MATRHVLRSVLLTASVLLVASCASQPTSTTGSASPTSWANTPLLEKKFQREANNYEQFQFEGQTLYCQRGATRSMPKYCFTEAALRKRVELFERDRNAIARGGPPYVGTVPGG